MYYTEVCAPKDTPLWHCMTKGHYALCKVGRDRYGSLAESVAEKESGPSGKCDTEVHGTVEPNDCRCELASRYADEPNCTI